MSVRLISTLLLLALYAASAPVCRAGATGPAHAAQWQAAELSFTSQSSYARPFYDVDMTAVFTGPGGVTLSRPAFWDGGGIWKVRFAPPIAGKWTYATMATNKADKGLDGCTGNLTVEPYTGDLPIYRHGFVRVSDNHRYFAYADGTPFFYLGDTHWFASAERFFSSNLPGCPSQFKRYVDTRVKQGFTVYQTEWGVGGWPESDPDAGMNIRQGVDEHSLPGFCNADRKFAYLAEKGMVQATALAWRDTVAGIDGATLRRLARYWSARYGAYPVLWTMAQEVDPESPHDLPGLVAKWQTAAEALSASDCYHHPLTAHMHEEFQATAATSAWRAKPYHTWYAVQNISSNGKLHRDGPIWDATAREFWESMPTEPAILYEQQYENYGTDPNNARINAYAPYLCGFYGHGVGEAAIWNDQYTPEDAAKGKTLDGTCAIWYEALDRPFCRQMSYLRKFFDTLEWWTLTPRFDMADYLSVPDPLDARIASSDTTTVALLWGASGAVLHRLRPDALYSASWFDPRTGVWSVIGTVRPNERGDWTAPARTPWQDALLVLRLRQ